MDKEDQLIRSLLNNSSRKMAPVGFTETVMRQVGAIEQQRIYRRVVRTVVLRTEVFTCLFLLLVVPLAIRGIRIDGLLRSLVDAGQGGINVLSGAMGILKNAYYLIPLVVLLIGRKLFATK